MPGRLPIGSSVPVVVFAAVRVAVTGVAFAVVLVLELPDEGAMLAVIGAALAWSLALLGVAMRFPQAAANPAIAVGDFALLVVLEAVAPDSYVAVRSLALFLIAVHAHLQGERRGPAVAALGSGVLVLATAIAGDAPASGDLLVFYETVFVLGALSTGLLVGRLRTTESASRLRARRLTRRAIQSEGEVRRRIAESIHDGPVQELIGLDMMLSAASQAARSDDSRRAGELIDEARGLTARNVQALRDEIVNLGPYAFEELTFAMAVENCLSIWRHRFGFEVLVSLEEVELAPEIAGDLFRITQEAVANAGRHAEAEAVSISLRRVDGELELRVTDNGIGFQEVDPLGRTEPGHLGLASMRERVELMDGHLEIETSDLGTRVLVRAPLPVG
jgi:signal transduction histidine kinase